ncbi:hypothetical protein [Desulfitobacterium metallireducens]|uniref:Uncharacterized protein n=1 Tax=Desulfitobacterium metallireducens DSM 15288 TaxID=871968 RepID=W0ECG3_9FIRM|nr:hypothetical protein [Desulfitobacterium metallireducens]AHF07188.1 hypothetical protein DESME_09175 [Desulfitobacterium metallireducens DSM 15288]
MENNKSSFENEKLNRENIQEVQDIQGTQEGHNGEKEILFDLSEGMGDQNSNSGPPPKGPKRKKRWIKRLMLALMFSFLAFGAIGLTQSPSASFICESCHEMKPEIATWKASSHSQIACINCHTDIGPTHFFQTKHFTKKYYLPIEVKAPVGNEVCENCHSQNRAVTPRGDLIVPHQKHEAEGIACTTCHIGVAHGGIAERQETIDGDFNRWDEVTGRQNMVWQYKTMSMEQCIICHKDREGPQDCESCHSRIVPPPSHQTEDWIKKGIHGQDAFKNLDSCNECHSYSLNLVRVQNDDKVISYARSNSFCVECHAKKPSSHNIKPFLHGERASEDQRVCLVCHEKTPNKKAKVATKTVCISCHKKEHYISRLHPVPIQSGVGLVTSCYKCHSKNNCSKCHK